MNRSLQIRLFAICFLLIGKLNATDLIVSSGGAGGAYPTINAAVSAANSGDRIIVYPISTGAAYSEGTITLTKSIQILSANEGAYFTVDANVNITPAAAGMSVSIMEMKLVTGSIQTVVNAPAGNRCVVNVINDSIINGGVFFDANNYNVTVANSYTGNSVYVNFGRVLGNVINTTISAAVYGIHVSTDAIASTDSILIIGNKITVINTSPSMSGIYWGSTSQYFQILNNFIYFPYPYYYGYGINVITSKNSNAGTNLIVNNTIQKLSTSYYMYYGIACATAASAYTEIQNNLVSSPIVNYQYVYCNGGTFSVHYNLITSLAISGFTNDGTNIVLTNTTLDANGKITTTVPASNAINAGNPDSAFVDINLTRNDVGAYGGSFTLDNYFPNGANDWARVFYMVAPRRVLVNGTINVRADGYDK